MSWKPANSLVYCIRVNFHYLKMLTVNNLFYSEQQIVDCSVPMGNYGCGGGSLRNTLRYLDKSGGLMAYIDYPYAARVLI